MSPANSNPDQGARQLVAQATNISTAVTLHAIRGSITTQGADAVANAENEFALTNRFINPGSVVVCTSTYAGGGVAMVAATKLIAGGCTITIANPGAASLDATMVINFLVLN